MTATTVLKAAADAGISVTLDGDQLVLRSRREPDRSIVELIRSNKPAIAALLRDAGWSEEDWLTRFDERAAILEYDGGFSRAEAETRAADEIAQMRRQRDGHRNSRQSPKHMSHRGYRTDG